MAKTAVTHVRLTPEIKKQAENILRELGFSISAAHELFYRQIIVNQGFPFELRIMKKETMQAINDARSGKGKKYDSVTDMFADLGISE
jgi:addiction module RelB/DinJ family antitoxin